MIEVGSVNTNLTLRTMDTAPKNGGSDVVEISMNFDDFVDMVNPLQHIPVVSTIYRAVTGESINPVSRIAGDALYGGVFGLASAGLSAAGAIGDEIIAANNDGKSASGTLIAALFDTEKDATVQVAENTAPAAPAAATVADETTTTPAAAAEAALAQETVVAEENTAQMTMLAAAAPAEEKLMTLASAATAPSAVEMTLAPAKMAFGGVMNLSALAGTSQSSTPPPATDGRREILQAQRAMRNNRFAVTAPALTPAATAMDVAKATPETEAAMRKLLDELQAMKAISQYQNAAQNLPLAGENVNIVN